MKKILPNIILVVMVILLIYVVIDSKKESNTEQYSISEGMMKIATATYQETNRVNIKSDSEIVQENIASINAIRGTKEWFICYLEIAIEYNHIIELPNMYDFFTEDEIYLMQRAIETECYDQNFVYKVNVANVILNRYWDGSFGSSIEEIITSPNQFCYGRTEITDDTKLALQYAFMIEDTTDGAIAFRSDCYPECWYGWELSFIDDIGHGFYIQREEEVVTNESQS